MSAARYFVWKTYVQSALETGVLTEKEATLGLSTYHTWRAWRVATAGYAILAIVTTAYAQTVWQDVVAALCWGIVAVGGWAWGLEYSRLRDVEVKLIREGWWNP